MFKHIKAVIFDMDGTLIDSMWLWKAIDVDYLGKHGIKLPDDLQKSIEGMSFSETAAYFKKRFQIADDVETIKAEWNSMADEYYRHRVPMKEKAYEFLLALKDRGIKLGIGTSNSKELVKVIMDKYEIEELFDSIRTSCEVDKGKPHPDIYLKVAEDLGVEPSACMVFEDVPNGLIAANNAGMQSVAVFDDFSKVMDREKKDLSNYYVDSYDQVLGLLLES